MTAIAVYSSKGGVGKTAVAVNLAHAAATRSGRRTLLWDLDVQGSSTFTLKLAPPNVAIARRLFARDAELAEGALPSAFANLDVLPADESLRGLDRQLADEAKRKRLRKVLRGADGDYDRIILDCPPGASELADQIFRAVDLVVVPVIPSPLAMRAYESIVARIRAEHDGHPPLMPVFSMADRRRALHRVAVAEHPDWPAIPYASAVEQMAVHQSPVAALDPRCAAARAFGDLWTRVERRLG